MDFHCRIDQKSGNFLMLISRFGKPG